MSKTLRILFKICVTIVLIIIGAVSFPLSVLLEIERQQEQDELEKVVLKDEI